MRTLTRCPDCQSAVRSHCYDQHPTCTWVVCINAACGAFGEGDGSRWASRRKAA